MRDPTVGHQVRRGRSPLPTGGACNGQDARCSSVLGSAEKLVGGDDMGKETVCSDFP